MRTDRQWVSKAVHRLLADQNRSADTHMILFSLPAVPGIELYLKDESTHPSGSLKHRLARSLFLYGLCNGWINPDTSIIDSSSGSTAVSEAYFAQLLGLHYVAVIPDCTSAEKIRQIEYLGGECLRVRPLEIYSAAQDLAEARGGYYMDQFTNAERATDWRGNNNIAESIFSQMAKEPHPEPAWVVTGAGTGGTSATIGRYVRYLETETRLCVADPDHSVFFDFYQSGAAPTVQPCASLIEGIGRPRVEPSFLPDVIDLMIHVPDAASIAAIHWLDTRLHRKLGGSSGTAFYAAILLIDEMRQTGQQGSVVSLIGDSGERYLDSYYRPEWLRDQGLELEEHLEALDLFYKTGRHPEPEAFRFAHRGYT
jgi:cysteine synthase A